jgi:hypothetical protein
VKRYYTPDIVFGPVSEDEEVHSVYKASEVQALLRAVAEEARKLRHAEGCHSFVYPNTNATTPHAPRFVVGRLDESKCNCPRGKVLAMLEVE